MTHQHGPLDFDPTATNRRVPLKVIIIVAVGSEIRTAHVGGS